MIPYRERSYDLLFSATYYCPDSYLKPLKELSGGEDKPFYQIYMSAYERMLEDTSLTADEAVLEVLPGFEMEKLSESGVKALMWGTYDLDWRIRMTFRERVVSSLVRDGIDLYVLGRGWHNHPNAGSPHLHILTEERIPFAETLAYMGDARINLNVMPWFKEGTHDRVFNSMLRKSVTLTDSSSFLEEQFEDGKEIAFYSLDRLKELPGIVRSLLEHPQKAEQIGENGFQRARERFTWKELADQVLEGIHL